jgi:hypothetical protein
MTIAELQDVLGSLLDGLPDVGRKKAFGHDSFVVGKKVFLFPNADGVVLKLPRERIQELMARKKAAPLVMGKRVMKEWAVLKAASPADCRKDLPLYKEALAFVAGGK